MYHPLGLVREPSPSEKPEKRGEIGLSFTNLANLDDLPTMIYPSFSSVNQLENE